MLGLDPGIRTGCKIAVVDATGKLLETATIYPHQPRNDWDGSLATLARLTVQHKVELIAIGNGTASRETDKLAAEVIKLIAAKMPERKVNKIVVSEAGASVYSASAFAAAEFPELDVSLRGAVSIARRLQDPLAELVKIEPKAIGVGQYQHDVNQRALARNLDATVEDCVNAVGVDLNTASVPLLTRVSGLNSLLAKNIVEFRNANGAFRNRKSLTKVPRLGDKTFEQAAGFLRVNDGDNPLDRSAVHPEAYPVVERILARCGKGIGEVMGQAAVLKELKPEQFTDDKFGVPTVKDILAELEKPGRDPRPEFKTATFQEGVEAIADLQPGMILEGVVTNVAAFGAFVDIGVHQDGLVHVSALANKFVKDPHDVVKPGQIVKVKVMDVDVKRQRIALTMRLTDAPGNAQPVQAKHAPEAKSQWRAQPARQARRRNRFDRRAARRSRPGCSPSRWKKPSRRNNRRDCARDNRSSNRAQNPQPESVQLFDQGVAPRETPASRFLEIAHLDDHTAAAIYFQRFYPTQPRLAAKPQRTAAYISTMAASLLRPSALLVDLPEDTSDKYQRIYLRKHSISSCE